MKKTILLFMVLVLIRTVSLTDVAWAQTKSYTAKPYTPSKTVFISSQAYVGNLGGIKGADQLCQRLASAAGLPGTYKAWLATSTTQNPLTRFTHSKGPYKLRNGAVIANNWNELWTTGDILHPINLDERGQQVGPPQSDPFAEVRVWTGMWYRSQKGAETGWITYSPENCSHWTFAGTKVWGLVGYFQLRSLPNDYGTLHWGGGRSRKIGSYCSEAKHIYCFQQ